MESRFKRDLRGEFGDFWRRSAQKEVERVRADLDAGKITIGKDGVARNCIGRALSDDILEKLLLVTDQVDAGATKAAHMMEIEESLAQYRASQNRVPDQEELMEMRAAFGPGEQIVDIITGRKIVL